MFKWAREHSSWSNIPGANQFVKEINIRRISYTAAIFILMEILNLVFKTYSYKSYIDTTTSIISMVILIVISVIYITIISIFYNKILTSEKLTRFIYLSFWMIMIIAMKPFFITDIMTAKELSVYSPFNITIICLLLVIIPMFSFPELCSIYTEIFICNLILTIMYNAPFIYTVYVFAICLFSFLISHFIQNQYINMIMRLNFEVRIDYLTGVMNRRGGIDKIHTIFELVKRQTGILVMYMIDIDYFKSYNDKFGHIEGDNVLKKVAQSITDTYGRVSDVVCRYGGEEFLVCSVIKNKHEAEQMAKKLLDNIQALKIEASNKTVSEYLTVSIGYVIYNTEPNDITTNVAKLIDYADKALYEAKNTGRNKISSNNYLIVNDINAFN